MYYPQPTGYEHAAAAVPIQHWQQQQPGQPGGAGPHQPPPPPPSSSSSLAGPQPAGPHLSPEAAAAFRDYGYGSVHQRGGGHGGRNAHQNRGQAPAHSNTLYPPMSANLPYNPAGPMAPHHAVPGAPYDGGNAHPAKRARRDYNAAGAGGAASPIHGGTQPPPLSGMSPYALPQQQHQQQQHHAYPGLPQQHSPYQPPLPAGPPPPPPQHQHQPQQAYYSPQQAYPSVGQASLPQAPQHFQYQPHLHQPMSQQPPPPQQHHQPYYPSNPQNQAPPLAVAPMKATPMSAVNRHKGKHSHGPSSSHNAPPPPPPPAASAPPPPPPPLTTSGGIRLSPKGVVSLPPAPITAGLPANPTTAAAAAAAASASHQQQSQHQSSLPPPSPRQEPQIPTGPARATVRRDTRPLPSQSRQADASLRGGDRPAGPDRASIGRGKPPTGPARGGGGGGRGGRGSGRGGGFFDGGSRGGHRQGNHHDRRNDRFEQRDREKGYKRTFSQTGPPAGSPRGPATRQRTDASNPAMNFNGVPTGPSMKRGGNANSRSREMMEGSPAPPAQSNKGLKRTLTDFRIESLEIPDLHWIWKATPLSQILARMNLKEGANADSKPSEAQLDSTEPRETKAVPEADGDDKDVTQVAKAETADGDKAQVVEGETEATIDNSTVSTSGESAALQRTDSRPEKRKHARDEDEDDTEEPRYGQALKDEGDDISHPAGKKVKSEVIDGAQTQEQEQLHQISPTQPATSQFEVKGDTPAPTEQEAAPEQAAAAEDIDTCDPAPVAETPVPAGEVLIPNISVTRGDDPSSDASSADENEVANSIIASRSSAVTGTSKGADRQSSASPAPTLGEPIIEDSIDGQSVKEEELDEDDDERMRRDTSQPADIDGLKVVPKKLRENSRLRIYFMSPVELERKEIRQTMKQKGKKAAGPANSQQPSVPVIKEEVQEDPAVDVPAAPQLKSGEDSAVKQVTGGDQEQPAESAAEDLDGEPVSTSDKTDDDTVVDPSGSKEDAADASIVTEDNAQLEQRDQAGNEDATENGEDKMLENGPEGVTEGNKTAETENSKEDNITEDLEGSKEETIDGEAKQGDEVEKPSEQEEKGVDVSHALCGPNADRLSIAYAQNTRRLVIDADVVEELVVYRAEGKIEICLDIQPPTTQEAGKGFRCATGIYIERATVPGEYQFAEIPLDDLIQAWGPDKSARHASALALDADTPTSDRLSPPIHHLLWASSDGTEAPTSRRLTIVARMDRTFPLTEAKWVRTGNPDEWITSVLGTVAQQLPKGVSSTAYAQGAFSTHMSSSSSSQSTTSLAMKPRDVNGSAWKGKIRVADPEAPPTFHHALENWLSSANSRNGFDEARYRFVNTHFQDVHNILEVLLRLMRGVGSAFAGPSSERHPQSASSTGTSANSGQSAAFAAQVVAVGAPYPEQQTPITLASFQLFKMGLEAAHEAGMPKADIDRRVGEVIRALPYSLIFRSLDSMFVDFKKASKLSKST